MQRLSDADLSHYSIALGDDEIRALSKIRNARRRREYICGHYLLRFALSHNYDVSPEDWPISHRDNLGPKLETFEGGSATFNLSHSKNTICCLVAERGAVGVDIEWIDARRDIEKIAEAFFSAEEISALAVLSFDQKREYFYRLWTLKESTIKAKLGGVSADALIGLCFTDRHANAKRFGDSCLYPLSHFAFRLGGFQISYCLGNPQDDQVAIRLYKPGVRHTREIFPTVQCYRQSVP